jgi:uncharacterized OsmC-like protein
MMGTFGGALEARQIDASSGKLTAEVTGEVETEEGMLVIRRIHVAMRLVARQGAKEIVDRTHGIYAIHCPLYRTLHNAIQLTSSVEVVAPEAESGRKP